MKHISKLIIALALVSCNQEVQPCDCYEHHEVLETQVVQGQVTTVWNEEYNTPNTSQPCGNETDWIYETQSKRYKVICQ